MLLAALDYKPGERYADFNASTDRVAEYELAALIGGVAAKKLGLLAVIGVALAKFWKVILIGVAVAGAAGSRCSAARERHQSLIKALCSSWHR